MAIVGTLSVGTLWLLFKDNENRPTPTPFIGGTPNYIVEEHFMMDLVVTIYYSVKYNVPVA